MDQLGGGEGQGGNFQGGIPGKLIHQGLGGGVEDGNGNVRGVVAFGSTINMLSENILETQIGQTGYVFVVND